MIPNVSTIVYPFQGWPLLFKTNILGDFTRRFLGTICKKSKKINIQILGDLGK